MIPPPASLRSAGGLICRIGFWTPEMTSGRSPDVVDRRKHFFQYLAPMTSERVSEGRLHVSGHISGVCRRIWVRFGGNVARGSLTRDACLPTLPEGVRGLNRRLRTRRVWSSKKQRSPTAICSIVPLDRKDANFFFFRGFWGLYLGTSGPHLSVGGRPLRGAVTEKFSGPPKIFPQS